jgi:hypothetical protein
MLTFHETYLVQDRSFDQRMVISSSTMICRTPRMQRGPDGVVVVTADMSIFLALHVCLSLSPLIAMFSMMGSDNTTTLIGNPRFLSPPLHCTVYRSSLSLQLAIP